MTDGSVIPLRTSLVGYSSVPAESIVAAALEGRDWTRFPGDFVVVAESDTEVHLISSLVAARPYFYAQVGDRVFHGGNVFELGRSLPGGWAWSERALRAVALLGHTFGEDTLHSGVRRLPAASHLHWSRGALRRKLLQPLTPPRTEATPEECLDALVASFRDLPPGPLTLSLSAGFDSRLLLALSLAERRPVRAICMGQSDTTDLRVARALAQRAELELNAIELQPEDYVSVASQAAYVTGGSKTADNWHTAIYPQKAELRAGDVHLIGANGEFARSFFLPQRARLPRVMAELPAASAHAYWLARMLRRRLRFSKGFAFLEPRALIELAGEVAHCLAPLPRAANLGDRLDLFYLLVRVRHFIGNGLALYAQHGTPCSPFLDRRWIEAVYALPRAHKLFDSFHRQALQRLRASGLDLPFNGVLYDAPGAPGRRVEPIVGYSVFRPAVALASVSERILDDSALDAFMARNDRERALRANAFDDLGLLWTLSVAAEHARRA